VNRRLLIIPVVGAAVFAGSQLIAGDDAELPPEPVFPAVVGSPNAQDWTTEGWSVNRFVDDPFQPSLGDDTTPFAGGSPGAVELPGPAADDDASPALESTTTASPVAASPTPTTAAPAPSTTAPAPSTTAPAPSTTPPSTTVTTTPPLAPPGPGGAEVPPIDDLPGPESDSPSDATDR
jgi:hypothetical protein